MVRNIRIKKNCLSTIEDQLEKFGIVETGGVLLGQVIGDEIVIEKISGPGPNAIHDDIYFRADSNYIDMIIDTEYSNSDGKCRYLGEWHTHPQFSPLPSEVDLESLSEIAEDSEEFALLIIVGAVDFSRDELADHLIALIKFTDSPKFYQLAISWEI